MNTISEEPKPKAVMQKPVMQIHRGVQIEVEGGEAFTPHMFWGEDMDSAYHFSSAEAAIAFIDSLSEEELAAGRRRYLVAVGEVIPAAWALLVVDGLLEVARAVVASERDGLNRHELISRRSHEALDRIALADTEGGAGAEGGAEGGAE